MSSITNASAPRYILIADDLTGANDTGVQLLNHGLAATVTIEADGSEPSLPSSDGQTVQAMVIDTESRNIPAEQAKARVEPVVAALAPFAGTSVFYKKVDSTMRGNLAAEVFAVADGLGLKTIVVTSAFPRNGRKVKEDILYVDGVPVAETPLSRDPLKPVITSRPTEVMGSTGRKTRAITLPVIRTPGAVGGIVSAGGCFCCDAETEDDLVLLIRGVLESHHIEDVLWVGSAGLAGALLLANGEKPGPLPVPTMPATNAPALIVIGSIHPKNRIQAQKLMETADVKQINLNLQDFLVEPEVEAARLQRDGETILRQGHHLLLTTSSSDDDIHWGSSDKVATLTAGVVTNLLHAVTVRGMFVTGGDIAVHVLHALGCKTAQIVQEVEVGVPMIRLLGGACPNLTVITKAGAFGNENTMVHSLGVL